MLTSSSTRIRPAFIVCAALFAALLVIPRAASAAGHGGGHGGGGHGGGGYGGGGHGGGGHWGGGGSHASSFHGGNRGGIAYHGGSHGGGWHGGGGHWGGGGQARSSHTGNHGGVGHHGGSHGGGWHGGGSHHHAGWSYNPYRWGYYPYDWGWGWAPYYSSWWGGPSVYVVTGNGDGYAVDPTRYYDEWSDLGAAPPSNERVSEENMDLRAEPLPQPAGYRARMRFKVTPADAAVYVDDKYLGSGEDLGANARGVVTIPGAHTITVARPGYKTKTVHINARIVTPVDVVVELER